MPDCCAAKMGGGLLKPENPTIAGEVAAVSYLAFSPSLTNGSRGELPQVSTASFILQSAAVVRSTIHLV